MIRARRAGLTFAATSAAALALPQVAAAHGLGGNKDLPVPGYLFAWGAAIALVASFVALGALWTTPQLTGARERVLADWSRARRPLELLAGAIGVALFGLVVYAGLAGVQDDPDRNLAPVAIYVYFWVAIPLVSAVLGDVFRYFSPWGAIARAAAAGLRRAGVRRRPLPYPERLGYWPAVLGIFGFVCLELIFTEDVTAAGLVGLGLGYAGLQLAGCALFGIEAWERQGDAFGVYFRLFSCISPLRYGEGRVWLRRPLEGLTSLPTPAATVALLCVMIGSTSFDGLERGTAWRELSNGFTKILSVHLSAVAGLLFMVALVALIYHLGVSGMVAIGERQRGQSLGRGFAHSLVPIALAYVLAHYFTFLLYQGQDLAYLVSDPLGKGSDLFGTANATVDLKLISTQLVWYVQVAALLAGHVSGLMLAHERALVSFRRPYDATRSQYWMLSVMVGFTCLGLWLLASAR